MTLPTVPPVAPPAAGMAPSATVTDTQALQDRFSRMMLHQPEPQHVASAPSPPNGSSMTELVRAQEEMQRAVVDNMANLVQQAPHMDMQTLAIRQMELTTQLTQAQMQFNGITSVAQNFKSGLQTLIKNQ